MKAKIALATVSGRAYYELVRELKERKEAFLSLTPQDHIPLYIKTVITTEEERDLIRHPNVLLFKDEKGAEAVVEEAIRIANGKQSYDRVIIGIDPGKTFGLAILADGKVLEAVALSSLGETVSATLRILNRTPAVASVVRIGDGVPSYTTNLLHLLDAVLPKEIVLETVSEVGTSNFTRATPLWSESKDAISAMKIAERRGVTFQRRRGDET
ncbi:MAG: hypothetical protein JSW53_05755 [Candidatus Bathyarchaeota archaeon]|nr:MAG: hypothetical protein JSW53_05755 [Candidatus Bathyarchaeota archaeon]